MKWFSKKKHKNDVQKRELFYGDDTKTLPGRGLQRHVDIPHEPVLQAM
jgi:hypothetical protein